MKKLSQIQINRVFNRKSAFNYLEVEDPNHKFKTFTIDDDKVDIDQENGYVYLNDELISKDNIQVPEKVSKLLLKVIPKLVIKDKEKENEQA